MFPKKSEFYAYINTLAVTDLCTSTQRYQPIKSAEQIRALEQKWDCILQNIKCVKQLKGFILKDFNQGILLFSMKLFEVIKLNFAELGLQLIIVEWLCDRYITTNDIQYFILQHQQNQNPINKLLLALTSYLKSQDFLENALALNNNLQTEIFSLCANLPPKVLAKVMQITTASQTNNKCNHYPNLQSSIMFGDLKSDLLNRKYCHRTQMEILKELKLQNNPKTQQQMQNILYEYLLSDMSIPQKQFVAEIMLTLGLFSDTVIALSILSAPGELQLKEEDAFVQMWIQNKGFHYKLWLQFEFFTNQGVLQYHNSDFFIRNLQLVKQSMLKSLFVLAKTDASQYVINEMQSNIFKECSTRMAVFPEVLKLCFVDKHHLLDASYNMQILRSMQIALTQFEKSSTPQSATYMKLTLCQFLVQCLKESNECTPEEINICQFLHILLSSNRNLIVNLVLGGFQNVQKVINNIDCFHLLIREMESLLMQHKNKSFILHLAECLRNKYKTEECELALKAIREKYNLTIQLNSQRNLNSIQANKYERSNQVISLF